MEKISLVRKTWLSRPPGSQSLLTTGLVVFLIVLASTMYWRNWMGASLWMPVTHNSVFQSKELWRVFTSLLVHSDEKHLLSNLFFLSVLGYFLRGYFGLFIFPIMTFIFGGIINLIVLWKMPPEVQLIGASGMVFWAGGVWLTLYACLDRVRSVFQRSLRATGVGLVIFFPSEAFDPGISYKSHFIGLGLGILFGVFYFFLNKKLFRKAEVIENIIEEDEVA